MPGWINLILDQVEHNFPYKNGGKLESMTNVT